MTAPLKSIDGEGDVARTMREIGRRARAAVRSLALAPPPAKRAALPPMAKTIVAHTDDTLPAHAEDVAEAKAQGATAAFIDRLALDRKRIEAMAVGCDLVRALADPVGTVTESWTRPNGMTIERVRVPLGVVGVIYE